MLFFIGTGLLIGAIYYWYKAVEYGRFFKYGVHTFAVVTEIEKTVEETEGGEIVQFWVHVELPKQYGLTLGKKYEKPIDPKRYSIGEELAIIQSKNALTQILIKKELTPLNHPAWYLVAGILMFMLSYGCCTM